MPIDPGLRVDTAQIPPPSALLRAFLERGTPDVRRHPVLDAAGGLARRHERRRAAVETARVPGMPSSRVAACGKVIDDIDRERAGLIARIDEWVAANVAHRAGASLHTETLGAVIDRMAAKWIAPPPGGGGGAGGIYPPRAPGGPPPKARGPVNIPPHV
ncbi:DUF4254 domain-containing protein [Nocardia neocaledoniensis]|uniref:DUF4254 domain-containing protein n=1 Tax=Nocardia neocaledoniensis TaxID=236511 RepID=UPI0024565922|nr:DUF4254 domain-containing protein [Nocardia neocaledoniensis]